jgi:hypothetical protein
MELARNTVNEFLRQMGVIARFRANRSQILVPSTIAEHQ